MPDHSWQQRRTGQHYSNPAGENHVEKVTLGGRVTLRMASSDLWSRDTASPRQPNRKIAREINSLTLFFISPISHQGPLWAESNQNSRARKLTDIVLETCETVWWPHPHLLDTCIPCGFCQNHIFTFLLYDCIGINNRMIPEVPTDT